MNNLYSLLEEREKKRVRNWKVLKPHQKHFILMYFYRLLTDIEHIKDYVETYEFMRLQITPDELPSYLARMTPQEIRQEAYDVIGKLNEVPHEPELA